MAGQAPPRAQDNESPPPEMTAPQPDTGAADPAVVAALAAYAAGDASERAALTALAASRLLVPVVATLTDAGVTEAGEPTSAAGRAIAAEKSSEMALPTLIGADGRAAVPGFTSMAAMTAWRPDARPVPVPAVAVCQAALEQGWAVVVDVAGPVRLAVEGARLRALAAGLPVPQAWSDPDVLAEVTAAAGECAAGAAVALRPPTGRHDLRVELAIPATTDPGTDVADLVGSAVMRRLGHRLRRGISVTARPAKAGHG
jgi:SseB protein N-terminal domain